MITVGCQQWRFGDWSGSINDVDSTHALELNTTKIDMSLEIPAPDTARSETNAALLRVIA